jgi:hypothetical protein
LAPLRGWSEAYARFNLETAVETAKDAENAKDAEVRKIARITPRVIHGRAP